MEAHQNKLTAGDIRSFLLNAYFRDTSDPVYAAANSSYLDLNRTIDFKNTENITKEKKSELRQASVNIIKTRIIDLPKMGFLDRQMFDEWHAALCDDICKKYGEADVQFHYGQAQKWVNMTMKYLSVIDSSKTEGYFAFLHVPIDSIVFDLAHEEFGLMRPANRWSRLSKDEYISYQEALRLRIKEETGLSPLLWEFRNWNR